MCHRLGATDVDLAADLRTRSFMQDIALCRSGADDSYRLPHIVLKNHLADYTSLAMLHFGDILFLLLCSVGLALAFPSADGWLLEEMELLTNSLTVQALPIQT